MSPGGALSPAFAEIRHLRTSGRYALARERLTALRPAADDDALEALVCLYLADDPQAVRGLASSHAWQMEACRHTARALSELLPQGDAAAALIAAREAATGAAPQPATIAALLLALGANALFAEAAAIVRTRVQPLVSQDSFVLFAVGKLALLANDWELAYRSAAAMLASAPADVHALDIASTANFEAGNLEEALGQTLRALRFKPGNVDLVMRAMQCHNKLGDFYATLAARATLGETTDLPAAVHAEVALAYTALGQARSAIEAYQLALRAGGAPAFALDGLIQLLADTAPPAALDALVAAHGPAIERDLDCLFQLGLARLRQRDLAGAHARFQQSFALARAQQRGLHLLPWPVPEPRIRHDYEQLETLAQRGLQPPGCHAARMTLQPFYAASGNCRDAYAPPGAAADALRQALGAFHYCPDVPFGGTALGANDYPALETAYFDGQLPLVVIDNFLSPAALAALREHCENATVWKWYNDSGYVGAFLAQGFAPRVLLEIADQLREAMPRVICTHALAQAWAFKYDQRMQGINMHADFAAVNVNFWITPDHACQDATTGGMVVYDVPAPRHWTFVDYNTNAAKMAAYLATNQAQPHRVPYRENRCVLFDSRLFHVTDALHFKPGYSNRRVNVTLLYGRGESAAGA